MRPPVSPRPRRSRLGLALVLAVLAGLGWELVGRLSGGSPVTPVRFLAAVWRTASAPTVDERIAYRPLPYLNFGLKPSFTRHTELPKTSNSHGFRGAEIATPKPEGTFRLVCLGGSTTYGEAVGDGDTYPVRLQQALREARPDTSIEVVNAGVPSYTTAESLANLAFVCADLQPDVVVIYHAANDYRPREYRNFDSAYWHYRKVWDGTARGYETGEGELAGGINPFIQHLLPENNGDRAANATAAGAAAYRRNLLSLIGLARVHGAQPVLVSFAAAPGCPPALAAGIAEHNRVARAVALEQDVRWIDLDAELTRDGTFTDAVHMNAKGNRIKAAIIAEGLLEMIP